MSSREPDKIIGVRKDTPLVAGLGKGCNFLASDIPAFLKYSGQVYFIENGELVVITKDDIRIFDTERNEIHRDVFHGIIMDMKELEKYITEQRRELHQIPETAYAEYETRDHLVAALRAMGLDPEVFAETGVSAVICGRKAGKTVALISDTDALAVKEETGLPFASRFEGRMHACGHVSEVIRLAVVGRSQSPDIWQIQQILGEERVKSRIEQYAASI